MFKRTTFLLWHLQFLHYMCIDFESILSFMCKILNAIKYRFVDLQVFNTLGMRVLSKINCSLQFCVWILKAKTNAWFCPTPATSNKWEISYSTFSLYVIWAGYFYLKVVFYYSWEEVEIVYMAVFFVRTSGTKKSTITVLFWF